MVTGLARSAPVQIMLLGVGVVKGLTMIHQMDPELAELEDLRRECEETTVERLWVLGPASPEMDAIERLLREHGEHVVNAMVGGWRVHPDNAHAFAPDTSAAETTYMVGFDCEPATAHGPHVVTIDPGQVRAELAQLERSDS